jgi:hypothetical protein
MGQTQMPSSPPARLGRAGVAATQWPSQKASLPMVRLACGCLVAAAIPTRSRPEDRAPTCHTGLQFGRQEQKLLAYELPPYDRDAASLRRTVGLGGKCGTNHLG